MFKCRAGLVQRNFGVYCNSCGVAVEEELSSELRRLRHALEAVSADLDAIERRPHPLLRLAAENLAGNRVDRLETCVSHFVFAVQRGELR